MSVHLIYSNPYYSADLILRNPELGNSDQLDHFMVNTNTIGLDKVIYRDPTWPITNTFNLTFRSLTDQNKEDLLLFLFQSAGSSIFYRDHESRLWNGVILNPEAEMTQEHNCNWSITLNFLGVLFPG